MGPFEDDPKVTNKRFPGNPTQSYRTHHPLRVAAELLTWQGHDPEVLNGRARAGLVDAAVAGLWAVLGHRAITKWPTPAAGHRRRQDRWARLLLSVAPGGGPLLRQVDAAETRH